MVDPEIIEAVGNQVLRIGTPTLLIVVVGALIWKYLDALKARWGK